MRAYRDRRMVGVAVMLAPLAACSRASDDAAAANAVAVVSAHAAAPRRVPVAIPTPTPTTAAPTPHPTATSIAMRPRKDFVDPPLPPELRDDGGLIPLPPPPDPKR